MQNQNMVEVWLLIPGVQVRVTILSSPAIIYTSIRESENLSSLRPKQNDSPDLHRVVEIPKLL